MAIGLGRSAKCAFAALLSALVLIAGCGDDDHQTAAPGVGGAGNPSGVGNRCNGDPDCATGTCYIGPGGGYCTSPCSREGDVSECPVDTVCKPIQGGPSRCLLVCGSESSCRDLPECNETYCPDGSSCVSVDATSLRACEPDPV